MKTAPTWLELFPFLQSQWQSINEISCQYPRLSTYRLDSDWSSFKSSHSQWDDFAQLRHFRKSRLAYLAYHDLCLPVEQHLKTMHRVSALADFLIQQAYDISVTEMSQHHGVVRDNQGHQVNLLVFALGKLGTFELNYSSDIDLVFVYSHSGVSDGENSIEAEKYFTKMGRKIIKLLDYFSKDGLVYRVDMRLRPFGSAGPLVCTTAALQQYLINEGREWERFAWMRARMVCGEPNDGEALLDVITPFIYRKHLDYAVFNALAKIKTEISMNLSYQDVDLKQGPGGIRSIEFIVQSLQLVFGGRINRLQGVSIAEQIDNLLKENKLPEQDIERLRTAWYWLRKTENISQIIDDQDVHHIPDNEQVRKQLALFFGCSKWHDFESQLTQLRKNVSELFDSLFKEAASAEMLSPNDQVQLNTLMSELNLRNVSQDTVQKIKQLLEKTIKEADAAVLDSFFALVKNIIKRPSYILMLLKEQNVYHHVLKLLQKKDYFKTTLLQYPVLLEQLFEYQEDVCMGLATLQQNWQLFEHKQTDLEQWMEQLRYFKLMNQFNTIRAWSDERITAKEARQQLSLLAQFVLQLVVDFSWKETQQKLQEGELDLNQLMVVAYGSMAVNNMSVSSDLDLVFVVDKQLLLPDERVFVQRWVKRVLHHLSSNMYHGFLYEIDLQLRPNGNAGTLVTSKVEFAKYQREQAWTWEHAALVKSKLVVGNKQQMAWYHQLRFDILTQTRDPEKVDSDLNEMSEKLKKVNREKQHNADFSLLGAVLKHAHDNPELCGCLDLELLYISLVNMQLMQADEPYLLSIKKDPAH